MAAGGEDANGAAVVAEQIIGLRERVGRRVVAGAGLRFRVVRRDGVHLAITMDRRVDRVDVHVEHGVVTDARVG